MIDEYILYTAGRYKQAVLISSASMLVATSYERE